MWFLSGRMEEADRTTVYVLAPQMGNLDMPPEDGYTWRKYGQKDILGSRFPRAYYRCTHQKLYNCPAKKQVQRLDNNPQMLKVTYRYHHRCHMSATSPSAAPPPPPTAGDVIQPPGTTTHPPPQPAAGGGGGGSYWLSMDIRPITSEGGVQMQTEFASTSGGGAGPSGSGRYGREAADFGGQAVVDMADAMFNSGSSGGNNSMDFIFHTMDEN
nr:WRKY transcription factor 55-like [Ipomoea trifida]GMD00553.1 WRKY transcription factor 55 [Ipomoea batatas]